MINNYFEHFLNDPLQYQQSEQLWRDLWAGIAPSERNRFLWETPWLGTGSPTIQDGNPIFSAFSPLLRRGVRVIQQEPIEPGLDFQVWLDTFGGSVMEPDSINELVIACVLSDLAVEYAKRLMRSWMAGLPISFKRDGGGQLIMTEPIGTVHRSLSYAA